MITTTGPNARGTGPHGGALLVFLLVLLGGAILLAGIEHIHHLGSAVGNVCFAALPLTPAAAAVTTLHHHGDRER